MNKEIVLSASQTETDSSLLKAKINESGDLVLEGCDVGKTPLNYWGKDEYEYWRTVKSEYKDLILLLLMKDRFSSDSEFAHWLDEKSIPSEFFNWF